MMAWRRDWRRARAIAWKDLTTERRSKAGFNSVVALAVTILVMFGFALGPDAQAIRDAAPGAIWQIDAALEVPPVGFHEVPPRRRVATEL